MAKRQPVPKAQTFRLVLEVTVYGNCPRAEATCRPYLDTDFLDQLAMDLHEGMFDHGLDPDAVEVKLLPKPKKPPC